MRAVLPSRPAWSFTAVSDPPHSTTDSSELPVPSALSVMLAGECMLVRASAGGVSESVPPLCSHGQVYVCHGQPAPAALLLCLATWHGLGQPRQVRQAGPCHGRRVRSDGASLKWNGQDGQPMSVEAVGPGSEASPQPHPSWNRSYDVCLGTPCLLSYSLLFLDCLPACLRSRAVNSALQ